MQTLLTSAQMRDTDDYTIKNHKITSIALMERAATAFVKVFKKEVKHKSTKISILCGQGDNGGDGLAIARLLIKEKYEDINIDIIVFSAKQSENFKQNLKRLEKLKVPMEVISSPDEFKFNGDIIIDAILGSGLNKPLSGKYVALSKIVNQSAAKVIAVDVPTGLPTEGPIPDDYNGIKADLVITFQRPKINFFFPESSLAMKDFRTIDIGLSEQFIQTQASHWRLVVGDDIQKLIRPRSKFTHKGTYGHAALLAGHAHTMGAALLAARGCINAGVGLMTVCLPQSGLIALNTALPEAMAMPTNQFLAIEAFEKFTAIGMGPGLGIVEENEQLVQQLIHLGKPLVVDADALTILSNDKSLLDKLAAESILTPHAKEFDRLFGEHHTWWQRVETARKEAMNRKIVIVLKNQYTFSCLPSGEVCINQTGNPAMASGGMGDILTGMITSFKAQGYASADAAITAVYLHGKAGDDLAKKRFTVKASAVAEEVPKVMMKMEKLKDR